MTTDDTTQQLPPESPQPRRLLRSSSDRVVGGVCAGLGRYFNGPRAKVELALAKGKDMYDKRRSIKDRDVKREIDRAMSERY